MVWRCLASALCLSWLSACILPLPPIPPKHQSKLDDLNFLKVGSTKKADVVDRLGAPVFDAGKLLVYDDYSEHWRWRFDFGSPAECCYTFITPQRIDHYHVVCAFDESGVLADYDATRGTEILRRGDGVLKPGRAPNLADSKHFPSGNWSVALSPNGEFAALSAHRYLYDDQTGNFQHLDTQLLMNLKLATTLPISETGDVEFSHDGRIAAILGDERGVGPDLPSTGEVRLLDTGTGATRVNFLGHGSKASSSGSGPVVRSVAFSQDGRVVASGASDGTVIIWDAESGRERAMLKASANGVVALAFSPDGKTLATTAISDDGTQEAVKVWDVGRGKQVFEIDDASLLQQDGLKISWRSSSARLAYSPGGTQLAINRGWIVEVLELSSAPGSAEKTELARSTGSDIPLAKILSMFLSHHDMTPLYLVPASSRLAVAFSPDGGRLAASTNKAAIMWDLATSRELWRVDGSIVDVALSADGTRLYAASETELSVYDVGP